MKKLALLLLKSYIGPFIVTLLIAIFILDMQFLWVWADEFIGKGLETWVIIKLMIFASAKLVNLALPLAILMSSIMTMGALAEHYELTAMKSSGQSLVRIMRPLIVFMVFVSIGAFYFSNNIWPIANLKVRTILWSVQQQSPSLNLQPNVFYNGIDGFSIRITDKNMETDELFDVLIYDHRDNSEGSRTVIRAKKGFMQQTENKRYLFLTLEDGFSYDEQKEEKKKKSEREFAHVKNSFKKQILTIDLSSLSFDEADEDIFKRAHEMMTIDQIIDVVDSMKITMNQSTANLERYGQHRLFMYRDSVFSSTIEPIETKYEVDTLKEQTNVTSIAETIKTGGSRQVELPKESQSAVFTGQKYFFDELVPTQQRRALEVTQKSIRNAISSIENAQNDVKGKQKIINKFLTEYHRKFFLAFSCLVLFFIGAPLGAIIRKGGLGLPTVVALMLFILYYIISIVGERMIKSGTLEPWVGMWISSVILFPLSIFLTYKAATDSSIMDSEVYAKFFRKLFKRKKKDESPTAVQ